MMGHHEMNGGLTSPGVYAGLHISPQMSVAAAAAYGRSPMVSALSCPLKVNVSYDHVKAHHFHLVVYVHSPVKRVITEQQLYHFLLNLQAFDPHTHMRAPGLPASLTSISGGKP